MKPSYLTYEGPGSMLVEVGICSAVPRKGDRVVIDGRKFSVASVTWHVFTVPSPGMSLADFPQQSAIVKLRAL